jgi:hypothetical protein
MSYYYAGPVYYRWLLTMHIDCSSCERVALVSSRSSMSCHLLFCCFPNQLCLFLPSRHRITWRTPTSCRVRCVPTARSDRMHAWAAFSSASLSWSPTQARAVVEDGLHGPARGCPQRNDAESSAGK